MTTLCHNHLKYGIKYTCAIKLYPWHDINGFILEKRGNPEIPIYKCFIRDVYNLSKKYLANGKAPGPNSIPNAILKHLLLQKHAINNVQYNNPRRPTI
jgi:hypothetical protein